MEREEGGVPVGRVVEDMMRFGVGVMMVVRKIEKEVRVKKGTRRFDVGGWGVVYRPG